MSGGLSPGGAGARVRLLVDGAPRAYSPAAVAELLADPTAGFVRVDLVEGDPQISHLLEDVFHVHPLALGALGHGAARARVEEYEEQLHIVLFAASDVDRDEPAGAGDLSPVHLFYSARFLVVVYSGPLPAAYAGDGDGSSPAGPLPGWRVLHRALDDLVDGLFPLLDRFDERILALEQRLDEQRDLDELQQQIFDLRRRLVAVRRIVAPARDRIARLASGLVGVPGMPESGLRYFRDLEDHLVRVTEALDSDRDLLAGLTDVHLSTISNRMNVVMEKLSVVAGLFLPLTFITGFFGQNFPWLVERIGGPGAFLMYGIGLQIGAVLLLGLWFRRRGWL